MAGMVPGTFPHDLTKKPRLRGEALVYAALERACDDGWTILYDRPIRGSRRRIDFVAVNRDRGVLAIEVKGGMVHDRRGSFRQLVDTRGTRKKIDPFRQLKLGLLDLYAAVGIASDALPVHQVIWFPEMGQAGLRWQPSPHILTRECLEPSRLRELIDPALPGIGQGVFGELLARVISGLVVS